MKCTSHQVFGRSNQEEGGGQGMYWRQERCIQGFDGGGDLRERECLEE